MAVKSTIEANFNECIIAMKEIYVKAHDDFINFIAIGVEKFCKSKISLFPKCEVVDNSMLEYFNSCSLKVKTKHLIDMLEDIRRDVMKKIVYKRDKALLYDDVLCSRAREKVEQNKVKSGFCMATCNVYMKFEVVHFNNTSIVHLVLKTYGCRV